MRKFQSSTRASSNETHNRDEATRLPFAPLARLHQRSLVNVRHPEDNVEGQLRRSATEHTSIASRREPFVREARRVRCVAPPTRSASRGPVTHGMAAQYSAPAVPVDRGAGRARTTQSLEISARYHRCFKKSHKSLGTRHYGQTLDERSSLAPLPPSPAALSGVRVANAETCQPMADVLVPGCADYGAS